MNFLPIIIGYIAMIFVMTGFVFKDMTTPFDSITDSFLNLVGALMLGFVWPITLLAIILKRFLIGY